ncbi:MAG: glycosyltransferase family 39 protein [Candidatus Binatia bacterium]
MSRRLFWGGLLVIAASAAVARVVGLSDLPPGLFCDEAALGYNAHALWHTARDEHGNLLPLYVWSFGVSYKNPVFIYTATLPVGLLGLSEFSVRVTSAFFGVLAVIGIGLLGRVIFGAAAGLIAALLLAAVPWHVHFSRIAFELIAFPAVFSFAFAALAAAMRGRPRWLLAAGPLFALCLYTYAPAKLFVPLFLIGALCVYRRRLWAARRTAAAAAVLMVLTGLPVAMFDLKHRDRSGQYFQNTTVLNAAHSVSQNARRVGEQYARFFSDEFLFQRGDPLPRHAVPGFGELYRAMIPLLVLGVLWCLWPGRPEGKLVLWWLVLYPIAPALMNEAPSASRGIIGVGGFCLLAAAGARLALDALRRVAPTPRVAHALQAAAVAILIVALGREAVAYAHAYVHAYPAYAAADFQFGYREAIAFMEARRKQYDLFLLTANNVNMPQVFTAFYNADRPGRGDGQDDGYLIIRPDEFDRYEMNQRILAALREDDVPFFDDYTELHRVLQPNGRTEYVIAEVRSRKRYLREWLVLGPFDNRDGSGVARDFIDPAAPPAGADSPWGRVDWQHVIPQFVDIDFNNLFRPGALSRNQSLDWLCAYATTEIRADAPQHAQLEIATAGQALQAWVNGRPVTQRMGPAGAPRRWPIQLQAGDNHVLVKLCKATGDWFFTARITDHEGRDVKELGVRAKLPQRGAPAPPDGSA